MNITLKMNIVRCRMLILSTLLFTVMMGKTQVAPTIFDLLETDEEVVEVTLRTDIANLLAGAEGEAKYQAATISFASEERGLESWNLKVKARGKFRRQVCDFPPIMLNFPKAELQNSGLGKHDKLKLVTHCNEDRQAGNDQVLREFLAYKLYQQLSPYSYRVQLVRMQYVDTQGAVSAVNRYAFIIEDTDELAARLKAEECDDCQAAAANALDGQAAMVHAMFQYLIGNADYSLPVLRNVKLFQRQLDQKLIPVGYDFDFSGFVNAPYALPANHLGQLAVKQRIYLGTQRSDEELLDVIDLFVQKKKALLEEVDRFKLLTKNQRYTLKEYLLTYFDQIDLIKSTNGVAIYQQLRQEHPDAIPDGGAPAEYGIVRKR